MTTKKTTMKRAAKKATGNKPKAAAKKSATKNGDKKMSALNAAAKVLGEAKEPLNAKTMIERMAAKG